MFSNWQSGKRVYMELVMLTGKKMEVTGV